MQFIQIRNDGVEYPENFASLEDALRATVALNSGRSDGRRFDLRSPSGEMFYAGNDQRLALREASLEETSCKG